MRNLLKSGILAMFVLVVLAACKKEELTPAELIQGKWIITSSEFLATTIPGDGSYLTFNACSSSCTGTDYKASDGTSGTFEYVLNSEGTQIVMVDGSSNGGSYNYTWDILELTDSRFRMTTSTVFGNFKVEMSKE